MYSLLFIIIHYYSLLFIIIHLCPYARLFRLSENSGVPEYFGGGAARVALGGALSKVKKDGFFEGAAGPGGGAVGKSNLKNDLRRL